MLCTQVFFLLVAVVLFVQSGKDPDKAETRKEREKRWKREDDAFARSRAAELGNPSSRADAFVASGPVPDTSSFLASLLPLAVAPLPVPVTLPALVLPEARNVVKTDLDKAFRLAKLGASSTQELGLAQCSSRTVDGSLRTDTGLLITNDTVLQPRSRPWSLFSSDGSVGSVPPLSEDSVGQLGEPRYWQTYPEFNVRTPDSSIVTVVDLVSPEASVHEDNSIVDLGSVVDVDISEDIRPNLAQPEIVIPTEVGASVDVDICEDIRPVAAQLVLVSPTEVSTIVDPAQLVIASPTEEVVELSDIVEVPVQAAAVVAHTESNDHILPSPAVVVCSVIPLLPVIGPSSSAAVMSTGLTSVSSIVSPVPSPVIGKCFYKIIITIPWF